MVALVSWQLGMHSVQQPVAALAGCCHGRVRRVCACVLRGCVRARACRRAGTDEFVIAFVEPDHTGDGMTEDSIREHEEVTKVSGWFGARKAQ